MNISYDSYRIFYYAAKYKSFSQAAAALYSNQPNVTRTIHRLEAELCCPLFSRSPQGVKLTPEGEKLYAHIAAAFAEARATKGQPTAIIAETTKGKGVSFMENQVGWHGKAPNDEQFEQAMAELTAAGEEL